MDAETFREFGKAAVDFIADYMENIRDHDVLPSVSPGYLLDLLPKELPEKPVEWKEILADINRVIMPGVTHWQSPNMHAFYPTATSYPSMVGEMLSSGFSIIGFNWLCSPACTELEMMVMDWLAKFLNLPEHFLHSSKGPGGGVIQGSASEAILVAVLAAREQTVRRIQALYPEMSESDIRGKLVAYSSDQSNSCVEKAGLLAAVPIKLLPVEDNLIMCGEILERAVAEDISNGLIPTVFVATMGSTGTCSYDDLESLAAVCKQHNIWLHVDAAYAGAVLCLDECADLRRGVEGVDSFNFNLHKMLLVNFDCSAMWLRDANQVIESFNVNRIYLQNRYEGQAQIPDFRHWQIPLGRRFRALKVWVTFRSFGAEGLRAHIRKHIRLAERFENYVLADKRFEIVAKRSMGLVCFRPCGENKLTTDLLHRINENKKIYMVQAIHKNQNFLRFVVCGMDPKEQDIDFAWAEIVSQFSTVLKEEQKINDKKLKIEDVTTKSDAKVITQHLSNKLNLTNLHSEKSK